MQQIATTIDLLENTGWLGCCLGHEIRMIIFSGSDVKPGLDSWLPGSRNAFVGGVYSAPMSTTTTKHPSPDPRTAISTAFSEAIEKTLGSDFADADPLIRNTANPEMGDFQCNAAMGLAKRVGKPPRDLAQELIDAVELTDIAEMPEIAGPGFINIRLKPETLARALVGMDDVSLGVTSSDDTRPVVVDLCGVNVAKQMHVGHLRSTIIGDALARVLERRGRTVLRENHLGDWGLPIAMVLHRLRENGTDLDALTLTELDAAYRDAQAGAKGDAKGLEAAVTRRCGPHRIAELEDQQSGADEQRKAASETLVALQQGDEELVRDWNKLIDVTMRAVYEALDLLNVSMGPDNNRGESFYKDSLHSVIEYFESNKLCRTDDGALVVDFEDRKRPLLIRKRDGGYLYATSDLAALRHRTQETGAGRCIYVVDARQRDHFRDVFDATRQAGWGRTSDGHDVDLVHVPFGSIMGPDKKPLKTRSGTNLTLASLLDEAIERGTREVRARSENPSAPTHGLDDESIAMIGRDVGIGAVKYADLSNDLVRDYVFDIDRMITFEGDTGPYLQYAHARICSMIHKAGESSIEDASLHLDDPTERQLALVLLRYGSVVEDVARTLEPHRLCGYLHEVADAFNSFYQACPVMRADDDRQRRSRLRISDLTRRVLADGLGLLGIGSPDRM